ncbi:MAG: superoxide dismutase [Opitutaceae bacterium]|nr:superoxide dismutase [Opitutaceae bacterium]
MLALRAAAADDKPAASETPKEKEKPAGPAAPPPPSGPFTLPELGFAYDALEPAIDTATMQIHHKRHHQAYIINANIALKDHPKLHAWSAEQMLRDIKKVPGTISTAVRNNVGGHANHTLFWDILTPGGPKEPSGALKSAIDRDLSNFGSMVVKLGEACMTRFGSGWAWLCVYNKKLSIYSTANQDSPLMDGATPILGIDVWEHAYYLKYQNKRAEYVKAVTGLINWDKVAERYKQALG